MKITELTTRELRRAIHATEQAAGPESLEAKALRKELFRRRQTTSMGGRRHAK